MDGNIIMSSFTPNKQPLYSTLEQGIMPVLMEDARQSWGYARVKRRRLKSSIDKTFHMLDISCIHTQLRDLFLL
jgi:hypothetical protein